MVLQSASITSPLGYDFSQRQTLFISFCPCAAATNNHYYYHPPLSRNSIINIKNVRWPLLGARASTDGGSGNPFNSAATTAVARRGARSIVLKRFSDYAFFDTTSNNYSTTTSLGQEDPIVHKLRNQLGVIHPIPSPPPINRNILGLFAFFFLVGVVFGKAWTCRRKGNAANGERTKGSQVPSRLYSFLEKDLQRKESVEWVNMVLGKLWKVYRGGIENWIIGLLQPVIDNLKKPDYVERVEIKQFSLGDEPLSVRSVERRTSRRVNDLQYQIGLRYTGGARMLLLLSLKFGIIPLMVPVGVRDFDIDGELWVKVRLIPTEPWVGAVSWAFVSLPKIKFELSPFRLFNLMAIPVLSMFLRKLLTEDLPKLFVRPRKIVLNFQKGKAAAPVTNDSKSGENQEGNKKFSGELSVTLLDARKLSYIFYGKTDPYVILRLGDQVIRSKKNSQTTVIGPPGEPIWNQDFHMLVADPRKEKLFIEVKDSLGFTDLTVGTAEVDLRSLKDTVPADRIVVLRGGWSLFENGSSGEILLRLTYKAYVEDEEDEKRYEKEVEAAYEDELAEEYIIRPEKESFTDVLAALLVSEEFRGILNTTKSFDDALTTPEPNVNVPTAETQQQIFARVVGASSQGSTLLWLALITSISLLVVLSMSGVNLFNP